MSQDGGSEEEDESEEEVCARAARSEANRLRCPAPPLAQSRIGPARVKGAGALCAYAGARARARAARVRVL